MTTPQTFANVFEALADTMEEEANLVARAQLMQQIIAFIKERDWKQEVAAEQCGVSQPRINDLLRGRISKFSLDALVNIARSLGCRLHIRLEYVPVPCPRCATPLLRGQALLNGRYGHKPGITTDEPDVSPDVSMVPCLKCPECGHSETIPVSP